MSGGVLPILLSFSPEQTETTKNFFSSRPAAPSLNFWAGPHLGALENQEQIISDLQKVTTIGLILFTLLFFFLWFKKQQVYFLLIPLLVFSIAMGSLVVIFAWGSIHGLTLAFGSGLIGVSMDYAFHGWGKQHNHKMWTANFMSFLTSLSAFILLSFFSIPLVQQLSLFAVVGLSCSFLSSYFISRYLPSTWRPKKMAFSIPVIGSLFAVISSVALITLFGLSFIKTDFSLASMDFSQKNQPEALKQSLLTQNKNRFAFTVMEKNNPDDFNKLLTWSSTNQMNRLGSSQQSPSALMRNKDLWLDFSCSKKFQGWQKNQSATYQPLFTNFLNAISCESLKKGFPPSPLQQLLTSKSSIVSIFKLQNSQQREKLLAKYPQTFLLSKITRDFPLKLKAEINQFITWICLISLCLLVIYFRKKALLALIPTFGAVSFVLLAHTLMNRPLSFISFVALIIIFGLTLDYGIFCTSYLKWKKPLDQTYAAISLSALTSIAGFTPLVLCQHPVLRDLGTTITVGLAGACIISALAYPYIQARARL